MSDVVLSSLTASHAAAFKGQRSEDSGCMGVLSFKQDLWTWLRSCDAANVVTHPLITCLPPCHAHPPVWLWKWKLAAGEAVSSWLPSVSQQTWRQTDRTRSETWPRLQFGVCVHSLHHRPRLGRLQYHRVSAGAASADVGVNDQRLMSRRTSPFPNRRVEKQMAFPQIRTQNERLCLTSLKVCQTLAGEQRNGCDTVCAR